ncbi:hypothetical protein B0H13DRAFT_2319928 [Mycena leptocephala]|nr:hypothetical protein B0H13DRAFT_2319928 [Mycena leptocephala]
MFEDDYDEGEYEDYFREQQRYHNDSGREEEEENEGDASEYNDGKGINYVITFHPQPPPLKPNEKRRSNARVEKIKSSIYVHEKLCLADVLDAVIAAIGRNGRND